ncbi:MAG: hypothetical protein R3Y63_08720 [Eubacteriales bacterium]
MSKEVQWGDNFGEGEIVCTCDQCGAVESFEFCDSDIDFKSVQGELKDLGWVSGKFNNEWYDFCSLDCRSDFN